MFSLCRGVMFFLLLALAADAQAQSFEKITIRLAGSADPRTGRVQVLPGVGHMVQALSLASALAIWHHARVIPGEKRARRQKRNA